MKYLIYFLALSPAICFAQTRDSLLPKVSHAEPLYLDLVRDLGARKGEKEINVGADFRSHINYNQYGFLVEYEFAPINRFALEVEADLSLIHKRNDSAIYVPGSKLECLRFSSQYSFYVNLKIQTTLAVGYTQIIEFTDFRNYRKAPFVEATVFNPFFIAAKKWGENIHTLIYGGPLVSYEFMHNNWDVMGQINTSIHYNIPNSGNFIGLELNKEFLGRRFEMTFRPQIKVKLNKQLAIGIVGGIPLHKPNENFSTFIRLIYDLK